MNLKIFLEKFINGSVVLETVNSPYNGQIKVDEDILGNRRLLVDGLTQSGKAVEKIWKSVISNLPADATHQALQAGYQIANCLILGLGAGNAAKIINKYFPKAKITGVEIDQEVIKLGKKYFGLDEIKNLKILISDAISFTINHSPSAIRYDLVLVDLYLGDCFPEKAEEDKFVLTIKRLLNPNGLVIFNRLYYKENIQKTDNFQKKLSIIFPKIEAKKIDYNKLFLCRK